MKQQRQYQKDHFKIDTSKVFSLYEQKQGKKKDLTYYIPGYLRLKVKNFTQMDLQNLNAQMNATLIFTVYYGDIDSIDQEIGNILASSIVLLFGRDDAIKLDQSSDSLQTTVKHNKEQKQIQFSVRRIFNLRIQSDIFWSPFQIINLILSITVQPVNNNIKKKQQDQDKSKKQQKKKQKITVKVNLMDYVNNYMKLSYTEEGRFGNYDLIESRLRALYSYERVCQVQSFYQSYNIFQNPPQLKKLLKQIEQKKIKYQSQIYEKSQSEQKLMVKKADKKTQKADFFQYAHFIVPLYKFPSVAIATIFLPLWLLAIINLGIFFQDSSLSDRIGSIAGLMIAFVGLIPVIRQQIPPNPKIVFIQILVYIETFTCLLALIHSLSIRLQQNYRLIWYQNGLFLASMITTLLTIIIIVILMLLHYIVWEPQYNDQGSKQAKNQKFNRNKWRNITCDTYFNEYLERNSKVKYEVLQPASTEKNYKKTMKLQRKEKQENNK